MKYSHSTLNYQKDRMAVATSLLSSVKQEPFIDRIITGDEKWFSNDNTIRKI